MTVIQTVFDIQINYTFRFGAIYAFGNNAAMQIIVTNVTVKMQIK